MTFADHMRQFFPLSLIPSSNQKHITSSTEMLWKFAFPCRHQINNNFLAIYRYMYAMSKKKYVERHNKSINPSMLNTIVCLWRGFIQNCYISRNKSYWLFCLVTHFFHWLQDIISRGKYVEEIFKYISWKYML